MLTHYAMEYVTVRDIGEFFRHTRTAGEASPSADSPWALYPERDGSCLNKIQHRGPFTQSLNCSSIDVDNDLYARAPACYQASILSLNAMPNTTVSPPAGSD